MRSFEAASERDFLPALDDLNVFGGQGCATYGQWTRIRPGKRMFVAHEMKNIILYFFLVGQDVFPRGHKY